MKLMIAGGFAQAVGGAPVGLIVPYNGTSAPSGWAFCDGSTVNGYVTPDLRSKFVVGAGNSYAVGANGGVASNTLASHYHNYPDYHQHLWSGTTAIGGTQQYGPNSGTYSSAWDNHTHTASVYCPYGTSYTTGNNIESINTENQPPFSTVAFIMKVS
jgi:microcystin-dependent protein